MIRTENSQRATKAKLIGLALTTALAGATLAGCATPAPPAAHSAGKAEAALASGKHRSAMEHAEAAVLADPRNPSYRAMLGSAYLDSGRFASAATAFQDAMALGDENPRTALSLALAFAGDGKYPEANRVLDEWRGRIPASDLGLAYSLAGQPGRGIDVLTDALRGGENTVKVRQNLAYSFALAGRWREARLMAAEDVPADKVGDRMAEWAGFAHPQAYRQRIASLLSVPMDVRDPGQPVQLALANFPTSDQLAAEARSSQAPVELAAVAAPVAQPQPVQAGYELPPIGDPVDPALAVNIPAEAPRAAPQSSFTAPASFESAFLATPVPAPVMAASPLASHARAKPAPVTAPKAARQAQGPAKAGSHLVQLGSFSSEANARRAWGIYLTRYPQLRDRQMVITRAVVGGKNYWRVSAAGYDARSAQAMCGQVKRNSGSGCFAYAEGRPLPGAVDATRRFASR